jgi:hypothetical protein
MDGTLLQIDDSCEKKQRILYERDTQSSGGLPS